MTDDKMRTLFPECQETEDDYFSNPAYQQVVDSFGFEELLHEDEGSYHGDSYYLLQDGARLGVLTFGWGSCSGCDALEACDDYADLQELWDSLFNSITWFDTTSALLAWFDSRKEANTWYSNDEGWDRFVDRVREQLPEAQP